MSEHATQIVVPLAAAPLQQIRTWAGKVHGDVQAMNGYAEVNVFGKNPLAVQRRVDQFVGYMPGLTFRRVEAAA